jgi:hypothetical protein
VTECIHFWPTGYLSYSGLASNPPCIVTWERYLEFFACSVPSHGSANSVFDSFFTSGAVISIVLSYLLLNLPAKPRFTLIGRARVASNVMLYLRTSADRLCIRICIHKGLVGYENVGHFLVWFPIRLSLSCG